MRPVFHSFAAVVASAAVAGSHLPRCSYSCSDPGTVYDTMISHVEYHAITYNFVPKKRKSHYVSTHCLGDAEIAR
jgi:hypothetical protein